MQPILGEVLFSLPQRQEGLGRCETQQDSIPILSRDLDAETWHDVLNKLNLGEMPPSRRNLSPGILERQRLVKWITTRVETCGQTPNGARVEKWCSDG